MSIHTFISGFIVTNYGAIDTRRLEVCLLHVYGERGRERADRFHARLRAGVPTSYNEFKQLSVFYGHTKHSTGAMVFLMLDVRCRQFHGKS